MPTKLCLGFILSKWVEIFCNPEFASQALFINDDSVDYTEAVSLILDGT